MIRMQSNVPSNLSPENRIHAELRGYSFGQKSGKQSCDPRECNNPVSNERQAEYATEDQDSIALSHDGSSIQKMTQIIKTKRETSYH